MNTPFEYSLREWLDHTGYFAEQSLKEPTMTGPELAQQYFAEQYADPAEGNYKMERFVAAQTYLEQHWVEFEREGFALFSSKTGNETRAVALALFRFYSRAPEETLQGDPPPIESMIRWTRESEQAWEKRK